VAGADAGDEVDLAAVALQRQGGRRGEGVRQPVGPRQPGDGGEALGPVGRKEALAGVGVGDESGGEGVGGVCDLSEQSGGVGVGTDRRGEQVVGEFEQRAAGVGFGYGFNHRRSSP
jgi:hypothetical protein